MVLKLFGGSIVSPSKEFAQFDILISALNAFCVDVFSNILCGVVLNK